MNEKKEDSLKNRRMFEKEEQRREEMEWNKTQRKRQEICKLAYSTHTHTHMHHIQLCAQSECISYAAYTDLLRHRDLTTDFFLSSSFVLFCFFNIPKKMHTCRFGIFEYFYCVQQHKCSVAHCKLSIRCCLPLSVPSSVFPLRSD